PASSPPSTRRSRSSSPRPLATPGRHEQVRRNFSPSPSPSAPMLRSPLRLAALSISFLLYTSPADGQQPAGRPRSNANNTLTDAERAAGWRLLFDGSTTNGWRGYKSQTLPPAWHVEDGTLTKNTGTDDIITTD